MITPAAASHPVGTAEPVCDKGSAAASVAGAEGSGAAAALVLAGDAAAPTVLLQL